MSNIESIKQRLKNEANKDNKTLNEILTIFFLERLLYRISISPYKEHFILKGGILLYAIFKSKFPRGTGDIDLLAKSLFASPENIIQIFKEICAINDENDFMEYDLESITAKENIHFGESVGVTVKIKCNLGNMKHVITIDIGLRDIIYPDKETMVFPSLLKDQNEPILYVYSKESIIAEKFEAMLELGLLNTRMKDFYDIYVLSKTFDFDYKTLKTAIFETLKNRKTEVKEILVFTKDFYEDQIKNKTFNTYLNNKQINFELNLKDTIDEIKRFILPLLENNDFKTWNYDKGWR